MKCIYTLLFIVDIIKSKEKHIKFQEFMTMYVWQVIKRSEWIYSIIVLLGRGNEWKDYALYGHSVLLNLLYLSFGWVYIYL